jgi:hypothetical protein
MHRWRDLARMGQQVKRPRAPVPKEACMARQSLRRAAATIQAVAPSGVSASSEVQAVQVHSPILVETGKGQRLAGRGEWLITEADGTVRVLSDELFRMQTLRQQLTQLVVRSHWRGAKRH